MGAVTAPARLGAEALAEVDLQILIDDSVATLARVLGVELSGLQELLPDGRTLLLPAGLGWKDG